jgi:hypothetical protein
VVIPCDKCGAFAQGARAQRANPESIALWEYQENWIPGLCLTAHPGMTIVARARLAVRSFCRSQSTNTPVSFGYVFADVS